MCGRFSVNSEQIDPWINEHWDIDFASNTNTDVRPTNSVAAITSVDGSLQQLNTTWGIKPAWAKSLLINAQSETVAIKKTFAGSFNARRCIIPCTGWFEWKNEGGKRKQKYYFANASSTPLLMAGIWVENDTIANLVTLTTAPNTICSEYHKRMPVLIKPEDVDYWFHSSADGLQPLMQAVDSESVTVARC